MASFNFRGEDFIVAAEDRYQTTYSRSNARHMVTYKVPWERRFAARRALLGTTTYRSGVAVGNSYGYLSREMPHFSEEEGQLPCDECTIRNLLPMDPQDGDTRPRYEKALLDCVYNSPRPWMGMVEDSDLSIIGDGGVPDESRLNRFVSRTTRSKARVWEAKGNQWKWDDGPNAGSLVRQGTFIRTTDVEFIYTWKQVPRSRIPWSGIVTVYAHTNQDIFDGFAAGTLIFNDVGLEEVDAWDDTGTLIPSVDISYIMTRVTGGANAFPDPDDGWNFHNVVAADGSGNKPYPAHEFERLFRPT